MKLFKKIVGPVVGVVVGVALTLLLNKPVGEDLPPFVVEEDITDEPVVVDEIKPRKRTAPKPA